MKTIYRIRKYWERWYPLILSISIVIVLTMCMGDSFHTKMTLALVKNASNSITIATVLFGFLFGVLTLLASLSTSKIMDMLRKANRAKDLLKYNRQAVYSSGTTALLALLLSFLEAPEALESGEVYDFWWWFPRLWLCLALWMLFTTFRYVHLFYKILEVEDSFAAAADRA